MSFITSALTPFIYLLSTAVLAGLISPLIYQLIEGALALDKIFNKLTLIFLVIGLFPICKSLKINTDQLGVSRNWSVNFNNIFTGFLFGIITMTIVCTALMAIGIRVIDPDYAWELYAVVRTLFLASITGLLVGIIEEPLFRGVLLYVTRIRAGTLWAIMVSASYYASLHFMKADVNSEELGTLQWYSGIALIPEAVTQIFSLKNLDSFCTLFAVGSFLALIRIYFKVSLGLCIGIHAGWVMAIKFTKSFSDGNDASAFNFLVGEYDGITGSLVFLWLLFLIWLLTRYKGRIYSYLEKN